MTRVACIVAGAAGRDLVAAARGDERFDVVGVVELGSGDLPAVLDGLRPDVVLEATAAGLHDVVDDLCLSLDAGASVVATCDGLLHPCPTDAVARVEDHAAAAGRAVLATGSNPSFVMDVLATILTLPCASVSAVRVHSVVPEGAERLLRSLAPLADDRLADDRLAGDLGSGDGHPGPPDGASLAISARLLARAVGVRDALVPEVSFEIRRDERGHVRTLRQRAEVRPDDGPVVSLLLERVASPGVPLDVIDIEGDPDMHFELEGGLDARAGAVAIALDALECVVGVEPGLRTVLDLVPVRARRPGAVT